MHNIDPNLPSCPDYKKHYIVQNRFDELKLTGLSRIIFSQRNLRYSGFIIALDRDQRYLRHRKDPYRRPPGTGAAAYIQQPPICKLCKTRTHAIGKPRQQAEWEYLSAVDMAGELQIEWDFIINHRLVL